MSEISNGTEENGAEGERKTVIYLTTDEMVGLIMEWAAAYTLPEWEEKMIENLQNKYDSIDNQPTEEEKIHFITAMAYTGMLRGSFTRDIAMRFLANYNADWVICKGNSNE